MSEKIIAYDLGTGGNKASLYDIKGNCLASVFVAYNTDYPKPGFHEQRPLDWWKAIVESTHKLKTQSQVNEKEIYCLAISGHSLGAVPLDTSGNLLKEKTPIWSDIRAQKEVKKFFDRIDEEKWYLTTGNGFPPACYTVFKIMWYRENEPEMFSKINKIVGTKDYINFKLTGEIKTDYSYASGSGIYDLEKWDYSDELIAGSGLDKKILPEIVPATTILGHLTGEAASVLDLPQTVKVACGGVDNSCMAAGAGNINEGSVYTSLGSSAWVAVSSRKAVLNKDSRPYVFTHVIPGMFNSAVAIFAAGSAFKWVKENICLNLITRAKAEGKDPYDLMSELAACVPVGSNKLIFNPSLAGATSLDPGNYIHGVYTGLNLGHTQGDLIRAAMEGITMNLKLVYDELKKLCDLKDEMVLVGGGSKSRLWQQIFADVFKTGIIKTSIGQQAGSLGAAAVAAVGSGLWKDFNKINQILQIKAKTNPIVNNNEKYEKIIQIFDKVREYAAQTGELLNQLDI